MNLGRILLSSKLPQGLQHSSTVRFNNRLILPPLHYLKESLQIRNYAARKGTRERKRKAKVKVEVEKAVGFVPKLKNRDKLMGQRISKIVDDSTKGDPVDDVFAFKYYKLPIYTFLEAVKAHRETHHPEMYNKPNADLYVSIELNMQGDKKTKFVDNFKRIAAIPHKYDFAEDRSIIAFAKNAESVQGAINAGAQLAGGVELIKQIQNGEVVLQDFRHIVAHPDILPELVVLRGIMKKLFPSAKYGTLDVDLEAAVDRFLHGIGYQAFKDEVEKEFGQIDAVIGSLSMDEKHLEENFAALLSDVLNQKPRKTTNFFRRCLMWSPPSREKFQIDFEPYVSLKPSALDEDKEPDEVEQIAL